MPLPTAHVTPQDVPLMVSSALATAERRITPSWTISQLKAKLEPVTGIPPASQQLVLRLPGQQPDVTVEAEHEDSVQIGRWPLSREAEINVSQSPLQFPAFQKMMSHSWRLFYSSVYSCLV